MIKALYARFKQKHRTLPFPSRDVVLPERFLGKPAFALHASRKEQDLCAAACPVGAISVTDTARTLDMGMCLFCGACQRASAPSAVVFTREYRLASLDRNELLVSDQPARQENVCRKKIRHIFGMSLKLRQVSAGGCNACEADINVLTTLSFDLGRFGIQFVASPRHADGIVVTGPVTENMRLALEKTYAAIPSPKLVIAVGACAISGGPYKDHKETSNGIGDMLPVDLYIPGCPPHPWTILDGLVRLKEQRPERQHIS